LSKSFTLSLNKELKIQAFRDISFKVEKGEFLAITGPSGIGKSSILKCIYRTYIPTSGNIWYDSQHYGLVDLKSIDERKMNYLRKNEIGYVSQFLKVIPRVSAVDVIKERLLFLGYQMNEATERTIELLKELQISESLWEAYPATFSGGEQQRINLARAFISNPKLLLLDEPTASLDGKMKDVVVKKLLNLKKHGTAMIGIFHDIETMKKVADNVLNME